MLFIFKNHLKMLVILKFYYKILNNIKIVTKIKMKYVNKIDFK